MKKQIRKYLALAIAVLMVIGMFPLTAFAADATDKVSVTIEPISGSTQNGSGYNAYWVRVTTPDGTESIRSITFAKQYGSNNERTDTYVITVGEYTVTVDVTIILDDGDNEFFKKAPTTMQLLKLDYRI